MRSSGTDAATLLTAWDGSSARCNYISRRRINGRHLCTTNAQYSPTAACSSVVPTRYLPGAVSFSPRSYRLSNRDLISGQFFLFFLPRDLIRLISGTNLSVLIYRYHLSRVLAAFFGPSISSDRRNRFSRPDTCNTLTNCCSIYRCAPLIHKQLAACCFL